MAPYLDMFSSGAVFSVVFCAVLALVGCEALLVLALAGRARLPRTMQLELLVNLLAGAGLLAAAALALARASWFWVALALATALFAHVFDLTRRLTRARRGRA